MYNLLMIYDDNQTWWENNNIHEESRLFEYTDEKIKEMYQSSLDKLKNIPCLFTYESQGHNKIKGYVGHIRSIQKKQTFGRNLKVVIDYSLATEYPSIKINTNNHSDLLDLGIESPESFELKRTHWAVKKKNLFKFISKYFAKKLQSESFLTPPDMRNVWGENYENKPRIFFSHKATCKIEVSKVKEKLEKEKRKERG